jgi:hypothetical protein
MTIIDRKCEYGLLGVNGNSCGKVDLTGIF